MSNALVPSDSYHIAVFCVNCRKNNNLVVKKGTCISDEIKDKECYRCGCKTLVVIM